MSSRLKNKLSSSFPRISVLLFLTTLLLIQVTCIPNPKPEKAQPPLMMSTSTRGRYSHGPLAIPSPYRQRLPTLFDNNNPDRDDQDEDYRNDPEIPGPEPAPSDSEMEKDQEDERTQERVISRSKSKSGTNSGRGSSSRSRHDNYESLEENDSYRDRDPATNENDLSGEVRDSGRRNKKRPESGSYEDEDRGQSTRRSKSRGQDSDESYDERTKQKVRGNTDYEGRYIAENSREGQVDPKAQGHVEGYPGIEQPMYAHPDDYRDDQDGQDISSSRDPPKNSGAGSRPVASKDNSREYNPSAQGQDTYDATYNSNHNWKVQHPSPETKIDYSPFPGFSRSCQSYFDCDFQPTEQKHRPNDNAESTWFSCDGRYCTCELFGFARDDDSSWRVKWSPKSKQCIAEADGPCGRSDGLHIFCQLGYHCVDNICEKIGKPKKPKPGDDCDDGKDSGGTGVNLFSVLFFPKNIVDSILNETLTVATGTGGKKSNNYSNYNK